MASKSQLKHGFKTEAEGIASRLRAELNIHPCAPLDAYKLAKHLNVAVYKSFELIQSIESINELSGNNGQDCGWSALTMITKAGNQIIIHNEYNTPQRQQSDLMHELAHIICGHKREKREYTFQLPFGMHEYNEIHEEEAKWLGATLQLSKPCLYWGKKYKNDFQLIADYYNCSLEMVTYRMNVTKIGLYKNTN